MQSIRKMQFVAAAMVASSPAFAHEGAGWAFVHWHASDSLGLSVVAALSVAALWLARRQQLAAKRKQ